MNTTNRRRGYRGVYRAGMDTISFDTESEIEDEAKRLWRQEFPDGVLLVCGNSYVADPQPVLACARGFGAAKREINKLAIAAKKCGGYEVNEKTMNRIYRQFRTLIKSLDLET